MAATREHNLRLLGIRKVGIGANLALDVLIEEGFLYDASIFPIHHDRYGIPISPRHPYLVKHNAALVEAPASTVRWGPFNLPIGGGGYFRILPYAWTRWGINRLNDVEGSPAIFYLHPWEIDPDQPRLRASAVGDLVHVRVEKAGLVALVGTEAAVIDSTPHRAPPAPRARLAVLSA